MHKYYYISQGEMPQDHLRNIETVCQAEVTNLVQLRLKGVTESVWEETAAAAREICDRFGVSLIINDNIDVALAVAAGGVHLGKKDASPAVAREKLPQGKIIGGTANTLEDCLRLIDLKVDYIGLGPFRFTTTKQKLSPLLGLMGYQDLIATLRERGHEVPVYAIGGITSADFGPLFTAGVHGIALSSLWSDTSITTIRQSIT